MSGITKPPTFTLYKLSPHHRWGDIESIGRVARLADDLGMYGIYFPDHIVIPKEPGVRLESNVWYDNFVLAGHLAALTKRVRLIFYTMIVPYRPPVQTAKMLSTLDAVSHGRVTCGMGAGWLKGEFQNLGVPFAERGAMTTEYIKAMKALWTEENPSFQGKHVNFSNVDFQPKCVQKPHLPIWIGGDSPPALRRAVELGDGWVPMTGDVDDLARKGDWIREQLSATGRDAADFDFSFSLAIGDRDTYTPYKSASADASHRASSASVPGSIPYEPGAAIEAIGRLHEAGFNHNLIRFNWSDPDDLMRHMEWFAAKVMPAFKD